MQGLDISEREVIQAVFAWGPAAIWAAVLFLLSAMSDLPGSSWLTWGAPVGHFGLYSVLGATLAWGRSRGGAALPHGLLLLFGSLYAVSDEWHQSFVPGRDPSGGDLLADALGMLTGYVISFLLLARREGERQTLPLRPGR